MHMNLALTYASLNQSAQAIETARKAIEVAGSQGQVELVRQYEDWLNNYRAGLSNPPEQPSQSVSPPYSGGR